MIISGYCSKIATIATTKVVNITRISPLRNYATDISPRIVIKVNDAFTNATNFQLDILSNEKEENAHKPRFSLYKALHFGVAILAAL